MLRRNLEHERLIPVVRVLELLLEEPVLNRRQRDLAGSGFASVFRICGRSHECGSLRESGDRRRTEQITRSELQASCATPGDHLDAENGVTAQLEEVVVDPHLFDAEDRAPDAGHRLLGRRPGRDVRPAQLAATDLWCGKRTADRACRWP